MDRAAPAGAGAAATQGIVVARCVISLAPGVTGDAVWWAGGQIQLVGSAAKVVASAPRGTPVFELPQGWVTPGLVDAHTHFATWALGRRRVQLAGATTRAEALARVAHATPVAGWILGQGWDANLWETAPDRLALDSLHRDPVYLDSLDLHAAWLNSAALAAAGIGPATPDPFGGRIVRDATGQPTGVLLDRAVELALPALPVPPDDELAAALIEGQAEAYRLGITGIHDVESEQVLDAFRRLEIRGALGLRVLFHPPVAALPRLLADGVRSGRGGDRLAIGGIKLFLDGSLGKQTAWMLEPYEGSRDRGLPISTLEDARQAVGLAARAGIASVIHAIGDAAVRRALDLLGEVPATGLPHRIEHFQCVNPADLGRAVGLGVVLSMQPAHLLVDVPLVERYWGARGRGAYCFRSILATGATVAFGSDVPVASPDPREGVYAATLRPADSAARASWHPEERIDFETALRAYTWGSAWAGGVAHRRGTLAPGQDADLVVWEAEADPATNPSAFRSARVRLTVIGGEVVMRA